MLDALIIDMNYITGDGDSFNPPEPCAASDQPIRQEEALQKAQLREEYEKSYKDVAFEL